MEEDSVKNENLEQEPEIKEEGLKKMKFFCPFCGNELKTKIIGNHVFCTKCHRRMPFMIMPEDKSVKMTKV